MMEHTASDGSSKLLRACTLPLTGKGVVKRVITDLAVLDVEKDGFVVRELAPEVTEQQVIDRTSARVRFELEESSARSIQGSAR
jgi:3-oxoacid CoA-transferase subunit B